MKQVKFHATLLLLILLFSFGLRKDACKNTPSYLTHCLSPEEFELFERINAHREWIGLEHIQISKSLSFVARQHAKDFMENINQYGACNLHSWSDNGPWLPVCYTSDHKNAHLMWSKPKELTNYLENGYEISAMTSEAKISPSRALELWKSSEGHEDVILNRKVWKDIDWNAVGIGIYKGYACVWFGEASDTEGEAFACGR